jgi:preprotein translocase subunit SecD
VTLRRGQTIGLIAGAAAIVVVAGITLAIGLARHSRSGDASSLTVEASTPSGGAPSGTDLDRTRQQLIARMAAAGLDQPTVDRSGDRRLVLHAKVPAGATPLQDLIAPDQLRIRRVLASADPSASSAGADPSSSSDPSDPSSTSDPSSSANPADNGNGGQPAPAAPTSGPASSPTNQPTSHPTSHPTNQPNDRTESGQPDDLASGPRAAIAAKLGPAYAAADQVSSFEEGQALAPNVLQAFAALTPPEIAALPEQMQLYVPTVSCDALRDRPLAAIVQPDQEIVACDGDGQKYLLDVATVTGQDIRSAKAAESQGLWTVTIALNTDAQQRFADLTSDLAPDHGQLAIVIDETIVAVPTVQSEIRGDVQISGSYPASQAKLLATQLSGGELPLILKPVR